MNSPKNAKKSINAFISLIILVFRCYVKFNYFSNDENIGGLKKKFS